MTSYKAEVINGYVCIAEHEQQNVYGYCVPLESVLKQAIGEGSINGGTTPEDVYRLQFNLRN